MLVSKSPAVCCQSSTHATVGTHRAVLALASNSRSGGTTAQVTHDTKRPLAGLWHNRPSGSEAVTRCHLNGKENGRFPYAVGFTSSATCLLKLGGKGTRLEIKVRRLGVRTGLPTQEGFHGYIWGIFRQFAIISNLLRCFTPTRRRDLPFVRAVGATQRTMKAANNGGSAVRLMSRKSLSRLQHDRLHTVRRCVTPPRAKGDSNS